MTTVLIHLQAEGFSESEVREHSLDWLLQATEELDRRYRLRLANETALQAMAVGAGFGGGEAGEALTEQLSDLRGADDERIAYLVDANAKADNEALLSLPMYRGPAQEVPNA